MILHDLFVDHARSSVESHELIQTCILDLYLWNSKSSRALLALENTHAFCAKQEPANPQSFILTVLLLLLGLPLIHLCQPLE